MFCAKPGRSRHGPSSPNAGMRTRIGAGVGRVDRLPVEADLRQHPGREVLHHHVGVLEQVEQELAARSLVKSIASVPLVRVDRDEERAAFPPARPVGGHHPDHAHAVHAGWRLDVDDVGAERGEHARRQRSGPPGGEVEDPQPSSERPADRQASGRGRRCRLAATASPRSARSAVRRGRGSGRRGSPLIRQGRPGIRNGRSAHRRAPARHDLFELGDGTAIADRRDRHLVGDGESTISAVVRVVVHAATSALPLARRPSRLAGHHELAVSARSSRPIMRRKPAFGAARWC